jgi:protein O-mannosyl-transferase
VLFAPNRMATWAAGRFGTNWAEPAAPWFLGSMIFLLYARSLRYPLTNYDDFTYLNPVVASGLNWASLKYAFTERFGYYSPLTWLSFMVECTLYPKPFAGLFRLTNVWLHIANSLLVLRIARRFCPRFWSAFVVALLFAIHPVQVESVVWISERRGLLAALFALLAFDCYCRHVSASTRFGFAKVALFYSCSVLAKPAWICLPALFPFGRWALERSKGGQLPGLCPTRSEWAFLSFMLLSTLAEILLQHATLGSTGAFPAIFLSASADSYWLYIAKAILPLQLIIPYERFDWTWWEGVMGGILLAGVTAIIYFNRRKSWLTLFGFAWFLVLLFPMSGVVAIGRHGLANRYLYLPLIGLILAGFGLERKRQNEESFARGPSWSWVAAVGMAWCLLSWHQIALWRNTETLFSRTLEVDPTNRLARECLVREALRQGRAVEAQSIANPAEQLGSRHLISLGNAFFLRGPTVH